MFLLYLQVGIVIALVKDEPAEDMKMKTNIETYEVIISDGIKYVIEKATQIKRNAGRPRNKMARYAILVRRFNGKKLYQSFIYNDGSFCKPF